MPKLSPYRFSAQGPWGTQDYIVRAVTPGIRSEMDAIFSVRMRVFVEEQAVPAEEELDAYDLTAAHFIAETAAVEPEAVGTARLIDKGQGTAKIGRVAVLANHRKRNVGLELMRHIEQYAAEAGFSELVLEAQCHAIPFYEKLGYAAEGPVFLDANIEHRLMRRSI
jgi:predicted GNAT family N-acyltransferase